MKLNSSTPLAIELSDKEVRKHTVASQIRIGVPFQLRATREHHNWTQAELAEKLGTTQNTISRLENPKTSKPTIKTLLRLAEAFDVGLLVRFVPFGFYGGVIESMDESHIEVPSYEEEIREEERKAGTLAVAVAPRVATGATGLTAGQSPSHTAFHVGQPNYLNANAAGKIFIINKHFRRKHKSESIEARRKKGFAPRLLNAFRSPSAQPGDASVRATNSAAEVTGSVINPLQARAAS